MAAPQAQPAYTPSALEAFATLAAENAVQDLPYSGDVTPQAAYAFLSSYPAVLVDVRTLPEWQFVGLPDVHKTAGKLVTISWRIYPDFNENTRFFDQLADTGLVHKDTPLLFICRSGGRSLDAAVAAKARGYDYCFNITDGFEGEPDADGRRGVRSGWKAQQLPWKQG